MQPAVIATHLHLLVPTESPGHPSRRLALALLSTRFRDCNLTCTVKSQLCHAREGPSNTINAHLIAPAQSKLSDSYLTSAHISMAESSAPPRPAARSWPLRVLCRESVAVDAADPMFLLNTDMCDLS